VPWFIDSDIEKCFDTIDQHRLINILKEVIDDDLLFSTLWKIFKTSVKNEHLGGPKSNTGIGVPQGNPLSPTLCNIYLTKFDSFVEELGNKTKTGNTNRKYNPAWTKATWVTANDLKNAKTQKAKNNLKRQLYKKKGQRSHKG
jgi:retron-type reverse transcriptase